ncbi:MAG: hypothetical protein KDD55_00380 [Bdellovibrionales bacterium]|nr:hypothetical protein [Bdellovibrionales bacterium]
MKARTLLQKIAPAFFLLVSVSGCTTTGNMLNPFYETPGPTAFLGQPNDHALNETANKDERARAAFDQLAQYDRALPPSPNKPVVQPAVIRLMWIPDHLNSQGDLVPAHYYYVKVKGDQWAVSDVHEKEQQLGASTSSSSLPYVGSSKK